MGMALGVLCAGLLLVAHAPEITYVISQPNSVLARFTLLVSVGLSFGIGAALTGAIRLRDTATIDVYSRVDAPQTKASE
jgi:hypothetical protein